MSAWTKLSQGMIPSDLQATHDRWIKLSRRWQALHYLFGTCAVVLSALVAGKAGGPAWTARLGIASAICAGMVTLLSAQRKAKGYLMALGYVQPFISAYIASSGHAASDADRLRAAFDDALKSNVTEL